MRKLVATVSLAFAIVLLASSGWHRFQHRYCNAQRLNLELADTHNPAALAADIAVDHMRERDDFLQFLLGGALLVTGIMLWTGKVYPERFAGRYFHRPVAHH
jgi:uncharacterized membrane protein YgdD (TMEM256/DUF423 family)